MQVAEYHTEQAPSTEEEPTVRTSATEAKKTVECFTAVGLVMEGQHGMPMDGFELLTLSNPSPSCFTATSICCCDTQNVKSAGPRLRDGMETLGKCPLRHTGMTGKMQKVVKTTIKRLDQGY